MEEQAPKIAVKVQDSKRERTITVKIKTPIESFATSELLSRVGGGFPALEGYLSEVCSDGLSSYFSQANEVLVKASKMSSGRKTKSKPQAVQTEL